MIFIMTFRSRPGVRTQRRVRITQVGAFTRAVDVYTQRVRIGAYNGTACAPRVYTRQVSAYRVNAGIELTKKHQAR